MPKLAAEATPNELLQYQRNKRRWTRDDVVENLLKLDPEAGVDANTIGRWERGATEPSAHHLRLITTLYQRSSEELGYVAEDSIPFWNIDAFSAPNPYFTGREAILKTLHAVPVARDEHRKQYPRKLPLQQAPQVLTGLGGMGKTQIAVAYARRHMHDYHTVAWVRADSLQNLRADVAALAKLLNLPEKQQFSQEQIISAVKRWFTAMTRWLLIFDDANNPEHLAQFLPASCYGHVLITTRSQSFAAEIGAQSIEVDVMAPEEAMDFLLQRATLLHRGVPYTDAKQADQTLARKIIITLGRLPLALDQAGAYIQRTQCGLARYDDAYQQEHETLLRYRGTSSAYPHTVASTWSLNVANIRQANPVALDLLSLLAFLHPDAIPEAMLTASSAQPGSSLAALAQNPTALDFAAKIRWPRTRAGNGQSGLCRRSIRCSQR